MEFTSEAADTARTSWEEAYTEGGTVFFTHGKRATCPYGDGSQGIIPPQIDMFATPKYSGWMCGWDMAQAFAFGLNAFIDDTECPFTSDIQTAEWHKGWVAASNRALVAGAVGGLH